jgi:hypothetical protein
MTTYNYDNNIPAAPNNPSADQPLMLQNFQSIDGLIGVDHFSFEQANKDGTHKQVNLTNESSPSLLADLVLYSKVIQGVSSLWAKNASGIDVPVFINANGLPNGYTTLFGGFYLQWGSKNIAGLTTPVSFSPVFPTTCFNVIVSGINVGSNNHTDCVSVQSVTAGGFTCVYSGGSAFNAFYWVAIGN